LLLTLTRFCLAAWVGGAVLFVIVGVHEVTSEEFDSVQRSVLVTLRFPPYYIFGAVLTGAALVCGGLLVLIKAEPRWRVRIGTLLVGAALILMAVDYVSIYRPLIEMITPPEKPRPAGFRSYHEASKIVNEVGVTIAAVAALLFCWPRRK
jgi:hypothetical protein